MLYNLRVRHNFLIIVKDSGMGKTSGKSLWADKVHVYGVREYGAIAKTKGLSARDGAFFCLYMCLEEWLNLGEESQQQVPDLPTDINNGTFSNELTVNILGQALVQEYGPDYSKWFT